MGARYIGTKPGVVRIADRPILPGDSIAGPPEVVEKLLARGDFEDDAPQPTKQAKAKPVARAEDE